MAERANERIVDVLGSSETGRQGVQTSDRARGASTGTFARSAFEAVDRSFDQIESLRGYGAYRWRYCADRAA